jgi:3-hydroxyacyl-CoA dehydrogenase
VSREEIMEHADIRHVAVIGTGTIGASWAAYYLSRGPSVAASDPAPRAETRLRRFVVASWPALVRLGAVQPLPDKVPEDKLAHQPQRRPAVAATLDQHVKDLAFVVDGTPQVHPLAGDPNNHLV